jgi:LuxR family maltose regulon positive regulatory protein
VRPADLALVGGAARDAAHRLRLRASAAVTFAAATADGHTVPEPDGPDVGEAEELVAQLPEESGRERRELAAVLADARATAALHSDAADRVLVDALGTAAAASAKAGSTRLRRRALGYLALIEALQGNLRHGVELARTAEALEPAPGPVRVERQPAAATAAAWVCANRYEHADARRWMAEAQSGVTEGEPSLVGPLIAVLQSRLFRLRHDFDAAEQCLRPFLHDGDVHRWVREQVVIESVRTCFAHNRVAEGVARLDALGTDPWRDAPLRAAGAALRAEGGADGGAAGDLPDADADLPLAVAVESEIARACLRMGAGDGRAGLDSLERALVLAGPEGFRSPFLDAPPQVRRLLRTNPRLGATGAWLDPSHRPASLSLRSLRQGGERTAETAADPVQELSERELEVLRHLAEMMSTAEIGAAMFVSINTVRTHIRSILRKLSVGRRNEAVRRARELKII